MKHVSSELRQLPYARYRCRVHQKGRQVFRISIARMGIQKEIRESPLQSRSQSAVEGKTGACYFRGALEVQNAGAFTNVPMRFRREIELRRPAPPPNLNIAPGVVAYGNRRMRQV